jgi:hypothetical protein
MGIEPQQKVVAHGLLAIKNKVSVLKKLDAQAYEQELPNVAN